MDNLLKFGLAYLLAPSLAAGVAVLLATAIGLTFTAAVIVLALLLIAALGRPLITAISRWIKNRFSPVRRRHPRPTAWHQWR
jgi:hypothetical protein